MRPTRQRWQAWVSRLAIRHKLLGLALLPLGIALPLLALVLALWTHTAFNKLLSTKVRSDLAVAQGYFDKVLGDVGASAGNVAESQALHTALAQRDPAALVALLQRYKTREGLDFIELLDAQGRFGASDEGASPPLPATLPWTPPATTAAHVASIEVLSGETLARLAPALRARVAVPLVPTRSAAPTGRTVEDRAMTILARAPVTAPDGRVIGQVLAGVLLNRNLGFIDHINEIVYPEDALIYGSRGTATLFLGDVRISTNVRLFGPEGEQRAIGTRVSQAVRDTVLGQGQVWLDRAFVVSDWYVSGYQPLMDGSGQRVGMLYVGFLERPFTWIQYGVLATLALVFGAVMAVAAVTARRWARSLSMPLERMSATMDAAQAGDLKARVGALPQRDEIGQLASHLDHLLGVVQDNTAALQRWGQELDHKVAERTQALEQAQQQLVRSEKLAAIGQLTASIAHEVNNPVAVIQGNLDVLREQLGPQAVAVAGELDLIDGQIERIRLIVTQLLQFARPAEYAGYMVETDTAQLLRDCLVLVQHLLSSTRIEVQLDLQATRQPALNRNELQQVLVNLLVNAVQAMPEGGTLTLRTRDAADGGMDIEVADTGPGLDDAVIQELFKPFVTHKKDGTGLGLWISRNIVERYGGDLQARQRPDGQRGALFVVLLK
jgi:signal transduction histidine kinase